MGIAAITVWTTEQVLTSTALNANFATIRDHYNANAVETSGAQTIAGIKTFSAVPVFSLGATIAAGGLTVADGGATVTAGGLTVSADGADITGDSTIAGTLGGLTGLTVDSGGATFTAGGLTVSADGADITGDVTVDGTVSLTGLTFVSGFGTNAAQPRARVTGAGETLQTSTTAVTWAAAALNVGTLWAGGAATRITIPANAGGSYHFTVSGSVHKTAGADTTVTLKLRKNGTTDLGVVGSFGATATSVPFCMAWDDDCSAADYYEIYMQAGTATVDLTTPQWCARKVW